MPSIPHFEFYIDASSSFRRLPHPPSTPPSPLTNSPSSRRVTLHPRLPFGSCTANKRHISPLPPETACLSSLGHLGPSRPGNRKETYPGQLEVSKNTTPLATHQATSVDLRRPRVAMHLSELELGLGSRPRRQRRVADDVSERLSAGRILQSVSGLPCCRRRIDTADQVEVTALCREAALTFASRTARKPSASCGRGSCGC